MDVNTIKTVAVLSVVVGCFFVLYPKTLHPIVKQMFGFSSEKTEDGNAPHMPPHLRKGEDSNTLRQVPGGPDNPARNIKHHAPPHPGMRAAAEMQKQAAATGSRGGGMFSMVLPMYAIGIVIYLVYTLSKVFGGKKKQSSEDQKYVEKRLGHSLNQVRYSADRQKFLYGKYDSDSEDDIEFSYRQKIRQQRDLDRLLAKNEKDNMSDLEMRELRKRLLETETQMTRILQAMEGVGSEVAQSVNDYEAGDMQPEAGSLNVDMYPEQEDHFSANENQYDSNAQQHCDEERDYEGNLHNYGDGDARYSDDQDYEDDYPQSDDCEDDDELSADEHYAADYESTQHNIEHTNQFAAAALESDATDDGSDGDAEVESRDDDGTDESLNDRDTGGSGQDDVDIDELIDGKRKEDERVESDLRKRTVRSDHPHDSES